MIIRVCIDVDDLDKGIAFFTEGLGLHVGRRFDDHWVELLGASAPLDLLGNRAGSEAVPGRDLRRDFGRHWTPVHLDFVVDDIEAAVARAVAAGATLERPVRDEPYGRLANLADPFGHGLCLLQMNDRGYDALMA
jgi:catechol 2,3-dioxygenase-like lactoylglutathione lyase family enzyme